jgi:hypothetical protein
MKKIKSFDEFLLEAESTAGSLTIPVGGTFPSGEFVIKNSKPLDDKMPEIMAFLKKYPINQQIEVKVSAMESQVPNRGVGLKPGELALKRTEAMVEFLKNKLKDFPNVTITVAAPQIGSTPWNPEGGDKADDEKFTKEQRVDIIIKPMGEVAPFVPKLKDEEGFSFSVNYDGSPGGKYENTWSLAKMGTWGFAINNKDTANKIYDFLTKGGSTSQGGIEKGEEKMDKDGKKYKFFKSNNFRTFDSIEDFKEFFSQFGGDLNFLQPMPNYFFQKPSGPTSYGYNKPVENDLRPLWKAGSGPKDKTL